MSPNPTVASTVVVKYSALVWVIGWVKLSGAFRVTAEGPPYRDTIPLARALHEAAPDRCVWGSDWPHVATWPPKHMPNVGELLDVLADWVPDEAARKRVFVDNPKRLYGF